VIASAIRAHARRCFIVRVVRAKAGLEVAGGGGHALVAKAAVGVGVDGRGVVVRVVVGRVEFELIEVAIARCRVWR
jgi:hypothetical protein